MFSFFKKKEYKLTPIQELLLALLRAQLWLKPVDDIVLPSTLEEWNELINLGYKQTVICFIAKACLRHPNACNNIPTDIKEELEFVLEENERIHKNHNARIVEIFDLLEGEGLHPILLKGQGLAQIYPQPELRQCGDIDIYIGAKDYKKACEIMNQLCGPEETAKAHEIDIHYEISKEGVEYEIHRMAANASRVGKEKAFNKWAERYLVPEKCDNVVINGRSIPVPSIQYNVIFVFDHMLKHFVCEGIKLRQIIDWMMLLYRNTNMLNEELLYKELSEYSQREAWGIMVSILIEDLCIVEDLIPCKKIKIQNIGSRFIFPIMFSSDLPNCYDGYFVKNKYKIIKCQFRIIPYTMIRHFISVGIRNVKCLLKNVIKPK